MFDGLDGTTLCMANNFQVKGTGRTLYRSIPGKDCTGEVVPFGEVCFGRKHSEDGAKLNMRWMRGVFVGKLDRTDQFLQLTTTGAMKTRCVRRLEGDNAWDVQFLYLCVGSPWNATARSTQQKTPIQQKDELESGRRAKKMFLRHNMFGQVRTYCRMPRLCRKWAAHTEECRARIEQEMVNKGDAIKLETSGNQEEIVPEPDVSSKKRKVGEPRYQSRRGVKLKGRHTQEVRI